nr:uncharacterized protein LOC109155623 isoform X3 [Ipomoea batatas]
MFRDVDRITDLDWCGYLLRSLVVAHGHWTQDRTRKFMGPLLFLILLYADRIVVGGRDVPRSIPTLNGWTTELLKALEAREITAQGFGQGLLDDPPHPTDFHAPSVEASLTGQPIRLNTEPGTLQPGPTLGTAQGFAQLFESKTGDLVLVATQVADMEPQTPGHTKMDQEEAFWQNSENIKALERAEMAALRATTISDMPSFSLGFTLGFTQDDPTQGNDNHPPNHQGPVTPALHGANRGMQLEDLLPKNQESPQPPVLAVAANRKGKDEVLFRHNAQTATWSDFMTLKEGVNVTTAVVDAWSTVLNAREKSRGWGTPSRLFASTTTTVGTVVDTIGTRDERIELFKARLDADLRASDHVGTATLDLVPNDKKYHDAPVDLLDMLSEYVESKRQWARAIHARNLRPKRMQMSWRDATPNADSAIFAMRHMESFTGQTARTWQCGLQRGNRQQLNNLRKRFMHNILLTEANEYMHNVSSRVGRYDCDRITRPSH